MAHASAPSVGCNCVCGSLTYALLAGKQQRTEGDAEVEAAKVCRQLVALVSLSYRVLCLYVAVYAYIVRVLNE